MTLKQRPPAALVLGVILAAIVSVFTIVRMSREEVEHIVDAKMMPLVQSIQRVEKQVDRLTGDRPW